MTAPASAALQRHDARPFFEKALAHGVRHGILDAARLAAINAEAPKGMVQIARYFGSEFLRPELEKARERMVNLISLYLLETTGGDLHEAAASLRDHSLLSRSKGGSDMLRRLIALPESSNFGMRGHDEAQTALLATWSLRGHAEYRAELTRRSAIAQAIGAAEWLAAQYDLDLDELETAGADAEAVIRMALLLHNLVPGADAWPSAAIFEKQVSAWRKARKAVPATLRVPPGMPAGWREPVKAQCATVLADLPRLLGPAAAPLPALLRPMGSFRARYFLLDDPLAEIDSYHRSLDELDPDDDAPAQPASKTWQRVVQGEDDEHSLLTLFVCLAAGAPRKTVLTEKAAASLVRKMRKTGVFQPELATDFIRTHAPGAYQPDYIALWNGFVPEAQRVLLSDLDHHLHDALALLRRECNVTD